MTERTYVERFQETLTDAETIAVHQWHKQDELTEDVVAVLLGDGLYEIEREREAFEAAMELDRSFAGVRLVKDDSTRAGFKFHPDRYVSRSEYISV